MSIFSKNKRTPEPEEEKNSPSAEQVISASDATPASPASPVAPAASATPAAPSGGEKYMLPANFDFNRYFLAERRIVLDNVSYETNSVVPPQNGQVKLGVKDTILAQLLDPAGVKICYNRRLQFEPEGPFTLSVTFSVMLVFNPGTKDEIEWKKVDIAEEFKKNCPALAQTMAAKAALIVAELTAANGGAPIIPIR